ncbi:hypothetical protein ACFQ7N_40505 [Streptomyces niveus]|uniref:hypothetical protein n=1 Tax=Streptomyces niveus TaxID=193462 RepID=UPI0036A41A2E
MPTSTSALTVRGPLSVGGITIRCPGRENAPAPRRLTLLVSGKDVMASCGERHRGKDGGPKAKCFFAVAELSPSLVKFLQQNTAANRRFRIELPGGKVLEGRRGEAATAPSAARGSASSAFAAKKAAARGGRRPVARRGGGTAAAALNAVAAVAGTATAAANAAGATAGALGKGFDMGREGLKAGQGVVNAADRAAARRFARENRRSSTDNDSE